MYRRSRNALYKVLGFEPSPYIQKVYAYMRYKNIPFVNVPATGEVYNLINKKVGWSVVPVVVTPDNKWIQDSEDIILHLEQKYSDNSIVPLGKKQQLAAELLQLYGDQYLMMVLLHYRWSFPENIDPFVYYHFGNCAKSQLDYESKLEVGKKFGENFRKFCRPLGINETTGPEIERSYIEFLHLLTKHFDEYPFFLGYRPSLGDFSVHGSIYAHLQRDPISGAVTKTTAPQVSAWCERMAGHVFENKFFDFFDVEGDELVPRVPVSDNFLESDEIPDTLIPILRKIVSDYTENIASTIDQIQEYADTKPSSTELPKPLIRKPIKLKVGSVTSTRMANPFDVYRIQKAQSLAQSSELDSFVDLIGGQDLLRRKKLSNCVLQRKNNALHLIPPQ